MEQPNLNYIKQLAGDDAEFENKFIAILKEEFPQEKKEYTKQLSEKNTNETALIVHKLKHKLNILGLEKAYILAVSYEEDLRRGDAKLKNEFAKVLETIELYLNTI